jgi:hypothetical protein
MLLQYVFVSIFFAFFEYENLIIFQIIVQKPKLYNLFVLCNGIYLSFVSNFCSLL